MQPNLGLGLLSENTCAYTTHRAGSLMVLEEIFKCSRGKTLKVLNLEGDRVMVNTGHEAGIHPGWPVAGHRTHTYIHILIHI